MNPHRLTALACTLVLVTLILFIAPQSPLAKTPSPPAHVLNDAPQWFRDQFVPRHPAPNPVTKSPGLCSATDWAAAIDSVWGTGLSYSEQNVLWNNFWNQIDFYFAAFDGLDSSIWQDVYDTYTPEILDSVSQGRLVAITQWSTRALREAHTFVYDSIVFFTELAPGVPLFHLGGWGVVDHFGAGLTTLPDSTIFVYEAVNPHPMDLVPGDIILGYDGVPWTDLYTQIIAAELPTTQYIHGSCDRSITEEYLVSAGMNWHLFDTIDVVKYATGDTVHLPTSLLDGEDMTLYATEQLDVPGVAKPDYLNGESTTWGVITGTNIGYIYSMGWKPYPDSALIMDTWLTGLDSLRNFYNVSGVILDFRTNFGANFSSGKLFDYLFDSSWQVAEWDQRCGPNHDDLCMETSLLWRNLLAVPGTIDAHWDRPLAILTGPGAVSGGDIFPMIISMHDLAKVFGKPSNGSFSSRREYSLHTDWHLSITDHNFYFTDVPGVYYARAEFPSASSFPWVDYAPVWLTRDGVASGVDDVVEAAKAWIRSRDVDSDGVVNERDNCPNTYNPAQEDLDSNSVGDSCECNVVVVDVTGDVNVSGSITSADIIGLVNYVFKSGAGPLPCVGAGDVNCSGGITSADIIGLVNYVFKSGAEPCDVCTLIPATWTCP